MCQYTHAADLSGQVIKIENARYFWLDRPEQAHLLVQLSELHVPESTLTASAQSVKALESLVLGKVVDVRVDELDACDRPTAQVYVDNRHVNSEMVRSGWAWCDRPNMMGSWCLLAEHRAKQEKRGLWGLPPEPRLPRWKWRGMKRLIWKRPAPFAACSEQ